jgi:hypothetical protein
MTYSEKDLFVGLIFQYENKQYELTKRNFIEYEWVKIIPKHDKSTGIISITSLLRFFNDGTYTIINPNQNSQINDNYELI